MSGLGDGNHVCGSIQVGLGNERALLEEDEGVKGGERVLSVKFSLKTISMTDIRKY